MKTKEEMLEILKDFDITPCTTEARALKVNENLKEEKKELDELISSLEEKGFKLELEYKDSFNGLFADKYPKDKVLYNIFKDNFRFQVYVACGDPRGIDFEVFNENKFLTELKKEMDPDKYKFYKKLLYYTLNLYNEKKVDSDGFGTNVWAFINEEVYEIDPSDLEILEGLKITDDYILCIPTKPLLGYEAQFFNRKCEDENYISYDIYLDEECVEEYAIEGAYTITEALDLLMQYYDEYMEGYAI